MHPAGEGFAQKLGLAEGNPEHVADSLPRVSEPVVRLAKLQEGDQPADAVCKESNGKQKYDKKDNVPGRHDILDYD